MVTVNAQVLSISHPDPDSFRLGAEFCPDIREAIKLCERQRYSVVVAPYSAELLTFAKFLRQTHSDSRLVLVGAPQPVELAVILDVGNTSGIAPSYKDEQLDHLVIAALEDFARTRQDHQLLDLAMAQNMQLKELSTTLESRIERRERNLLRSRRRVATARARIESLHRAITSIQKAESIAEMEHLLYESLSAVMRLSWVRIRFHNQHSLQSGDSIAGDFEILDLPLQLQIHPSQAHQGTLAFSRDRSKPFTHEERDFLSQVGEVVTLSINRLMALQQAEGLKQQWDSTFDAIGDPLCLTDEDFRILRTNRAFSRAAHKSFDELLGRDAFLEFIGNKPDLSTLSQGGSFQITKKSASSTTPSSVYEVTCHRFRPNPVQNSLQIIVFRDITETQRLERQLLESNKLAELGTIASSIAHELNNPLGGLISFLQLIKMDLPASSDIREDILQMEAAGKKCKEIVENLLGFSRMHTQSDPEGFDLSDAIEHSLKIVELTTRSQGIEVSWQRPNFEAPFFGQFNPLSQALRNIVQNACEAVVQRRKSERTPGGKVTVQLTVLDKEYVIEVMDNGIGMSDQELRLAFNPLYSTKDPATNLGLGLTVAFQILQQHRGRLEFSSQPKIGTTAKISLERPDLAAQRRDFDSKI